MSVTVSDKGQVTIPQSVRERLGIVPGSVVEFHHAADGGVVLRRAEQEPPQSRMTALRGHAGPGHSTDEIIALTRGEE